MALSLPPQHRALVLPNTTEGFQVQTIPTPQPFHGSAVVRILHAVVVSYHREIYNGDRHYAFPTPIVGGAGAIGRIAAVGPDATALQPDQLVYVDDVVRGRDDPTALFLSAINEGGSEGSKKLMREVWRDSVWAQFANVPLENCITLSETRLCKELGYSLEELTYLVYLLVPYGGLRDIDVKPGETIVMAPATGGFGGAGVAVAVAMGARVIAMGRNEKELARLKEYVQKGTPFMADNIETVKMSGDEAKDLAAIQAFGPIDAVLDLSPPAAANSTHLKTAVSALRHSGRCSVMGMATPWGVSAWAFIGNNITVKGKLMYERQDMLDFVKMLERGLFPRSKDLVDVKSFKMEECKQAMDVAAEHTGIGRLVVMSP